MSKKKGTSPYIQGGRGSVEKLSIRRKVFSEKKKRKSLKVWKEGDQTTSLKKGNVGFSMSGQQDPLAAKTKKMTAN